jgi:hypothetical protein
MDAARKAGSSNCHAFCVPFYVAFLGICHYKHFNPDYKDKKEFDSGKAPVGRKIKIVFKDGELMVGTTNGYQPGRPGFFIVPADPNSNIERCYILSAATQEVSFI